MTVGHTDMMNMLIYRVYCDIKSKSGHMLSVYINYCNTVNREFNPISELRLITHIVCLQEYSRMPSETDTLCGA